MSDEVVQTDPVELLLILASIKAAEEVLSKQKEDIQARLVEIMQSNSRGTMTAKSSDGRVVKGTLVVAERVIIDSDRLKDALPAKMWDKITTRVLDKGLLEAHVTTKAIDENVVASCSEIKANKPYVRVSGDLPTMTGIEAVTVRTEAGMEKPAMKRVKAKKAAAARLG